MPERAAAAFFARASESLEGEAVFRGFLGADSNFRAEELAEVLTAGLEGAAGFIGAGGLDEGDLTGAGLTGTDLDEVLAEREAGRFAKGSPEIIRAERDAGPIKSMYLFTFSVISLILAF